MSRKANQPSVIQQDEALYKAYKDQIKRHTPQKLAGYGLVSNTTLYKYLNGEAINLAKEDAIIESLKLANTQKEKDDQARLEAARQALQPQLEAA